MRVGFEKRGEKRLKCNQTIHGMTHWFMQQVVPGNRRTIKGRAILCARTRKSCNNASEGLQQTEGTNGS
ncbi:hypothetical protein HAX54_048345, partial [Datura stramonium]|nr:hypothetical protein [Datura stramonium]